MRNEGVYAYGNNYTENQNTPVAEMKPERLDLVTLIGNILEKDGLVDDKKEEINEKSVIILNSCITETLPNNLNGSLNRMITWLEAQNAVNVGFNLGDSLNMVSLKKTN